MSSEDIAILQVTMANLEITDLTNRKAKLEVKTIAYVNTETQANEELKGIKNGVVGLDTEFVKRALGGDEKLIDDIPTMAPALKKAARTALQYIQSIKGDFEPNWERAGLCLVQIAHEDKAILISPLIIKAGAGLISDAAILWEDVRVDAKNLVDAGLMTRLWQAESRKDDAFTFMGLDTAAKLALDIEMDKTYQKGVNWKEEPHQAQLTYAALDAVVGLRLFQKLDPMLKTIADQEDVVFSTSWYTFNSCMGEPMRTRKSIRGADIPWSTKDCTWFSSGKFQGKYF
ncbi:ribonuclease H-like domain-containing protein [Mycena metata]|uniref:Ribonuclease H-like domain-containing protein n=1 Tax=Mycena metata TaxID=1033252 RepID=A0AAD7JJ40_9AGAR|nr:ribonuclease H-like domain-containing protein [Mycena metata]